MPLAGLIPTLPSTLFDTVVKVVGFLGALLLIYSVLLEKERRRDAVLVVGSACLFVYSLTLGNKIFMIFSLGNFLFSGVELVQILRGKHVHNEALVEEYKHPEK